LAAVPYIDFAGGMFQHGNRVCVKYGRYLYEKVAGVTLPRNVTVINTSNKLWPEFEYLRLSVRGRRASADVAEMIQEDIREGA